MTDQTPATRSSNGNLWVIVPFVLAVIGTVVMLFTNSANALKVALIFALWAGAAGIMVIEHTRRDRDRAAAELAQARRQLEAEPAPAPEPAQPAPLSDADMAVIRELQEELKALRAQLEEMRGAAFEYEPAAVRASARRIQELEEPERPESERPAPRPGPSNDDTTRIAPVNAPAPGRPAGAPSADAVAGRLGQQPTREHPNPLSALISEREAQKPAPKPEPEHRGGRRRRDERGDGGLTVAELLARRAQGE